MSTTKTKEDTTMKKTTNTALNTALTAVLDLWDEALANGDIEVNEAADRAYRELLRVWERAN